MDLSVCHRAVSVGDANDVARLAREALAEHLEAGGGCTCPPMRSSGIPGEHAKPRKQASDDMGDPIPPCISILKSIDNDVWRYHITRCQCAVLSAICGAVIIEQDVCKYRWSITEPCLFLLSITRLFRQGSSCMVAAAAFSLLAPEPLGSWPSSRTHARLRVLT
jgi:hypothetical protein